MELVGRWVSNKDAALWYIRQGLPVIPVCSHDHSGMSASHKARCKSPGKAPLVLDWTRYAGEVPSEDQIKEWWTQWPDANLGAPTGPLWGVALDIDPRHGGYVGKPDRPIPSTMTNNTGGGGQHAWRLKSA